MRPRASRPGQEVESVPVIKRTILLAAPAAILLLAGPAAAQTITSPYDFVENAHSFRAHVTYVAADRGVIGIGPGSGVAGGVGYTYRVTGPFTLDTRFSYFPTSRTVYTVDDDADPDQIADDPTVGLEEIGTADLSLALLDVSLRFDITGPRTWHRLQPYAMLGVGGIFRASTDNSAEEALREDLDLRVRFRNGVTGHIGAGIEWHLSPGLSMRFDARNLFWRVHVPTGFITTGRVIDDREWTGSAQLGVAAALRF